MRIIQILLALIVALMLASCNIRFVAPEGGIFATWSSAFNCVSQKTCNIDIVDFHFDEIFVPKPAAYFTFNFWQKAYQTFCILDTKSCQFFAVGSNGNEDSAGVTMSFFKSSSGVSSSQPAFEKESAGVVTIDLNGSWEYEEKQGTCFARGAITQSVRPNTEICQEISSESQQVISNSTESCMLHTFTGGLDICLSVKIPRGPVSEQMAQEAWEESYTVYDPKIHPGFVFLSSNEYRIVWKTGRVRTYSRVGSVDSLGDAVCEGVCDDDKCARSKLTPSDSSRNADSSLQPKFPGISFVSAEFTTRYSPFDRFLYLDRFKNNQQNIGLSLLPFLDALTSSSATINTILQELESGLTNVARSLGLTLNEFRLLNDGRNMYQPTSIGYQTVSTEPGWSLLEKSKSVFHMVGLEKEQIEKWVNIDGREYVYIRIDDIPIMVNDGINDGTFNYGMNPYSFSHVGLDVLPWILWGIGPQDRQTPEDRLELFSKSDYRTALVQFLRR